MNRQFLITFLLTGALMLVSACDSDTSLPTLRPTVGSSAPEPTVDPSLGSGFDPNLGNTDDVATAIPTPTRESQTTVSGDNESGARGIGFLAQITGGSLSNVNNGGQYDCTLNGHRVVSSVDASPNITFTVPATEPLRTHTFIGADADGSATAIVTLASIDDTYTQVTGGTLTLDNVPSSDGDFVSGEFNFTIRNNNGDEIGVMGEFDFETTGTSYCT